MRKTKKAFTLIELLIVISIIGILASVALVSLRTAREKALEAKYVNYVSLMTRLVKAAVVEGAFEANSVPVTADASRGCLGDYISVGKTCWNSNPDYDDSPPDPELLAALETFGPLPQGEVNPHHPTRGVVVVNSTTAVSIYAYTGEDHQDLCPKFGWGEGNIIIPSNRMFCRLIIYKD